MDRSKTDAADAAIKTLDGLGYTFDPETEQWNLDTDVPLPKVPSTQLYRPRRIDGDVIRCYRCNSIAPTTRVLGKYLNTPHADEQEILLPVCKFCYETELGRLLSEGPSELKPLVRGVCQAFNMIYWENKYGRLD